jgi:hypothetical protein
LLLLLLLSLRPPVPWPLRVRSIGPDQARIHASISPSLLALVRRSASRSLHPTAAAEPSPAWGTQGHDRPACCTVGNGCKRALAL